MDFNEIKSTWKNSMNAEPKLNKKEIESKLKIGNDSNTALNKVKRNYRIELFLGGFIGLLFIFWMYINLNDRYKYALLTIAVLFFGVLISFTWKNYLKVRRTVISTGQLKPALLKTINDIEKYVDFNTSNFSKFLLMPFAIFFGMIIGIFIDAGNQPLSQIFSWGEILKITFILTLLSAFFIPFSQFMTRKMYKQHLDELKQCLKEFQDIEDESYDDPKA